MQVSRRFCTLTSPESIVRKPVIQDRSHDDLFAQVKRPGFCEPCSRLPTAGSIAARVSRWPAPWRCVCAPAFQRRAPLRQPDDRPTVRTQIMRAPAFQRRAPLRQPGPGRVATSATRVLPPSNGGLHCGLHIPWWPLACCPSAPAFQRRAPLRRRTALGDLRLRVTSRAPAFQRRAPLRLPDRIRFTCSRVSQCSRLPTAGSIAAGSVGPSAERERRGVLPPSNGGLHCGALCGPACSSGVTARRRCSRLPTAGSIAARRAGSRRASI